MNSEESENSIFISPTFNGVVTFLDILSVEGTLYFVLTDVPDNTVNVLFDVKGAGFNFSLVLRDNEFILCYHDFDL